MTPNRRALVAAGTLLAASMVLGLLVATGGHPVPGPDRWVADQLFRITRRHAALATTALWVQAVTQPNWLRLAVVVWAIALWIRGSRRAAAWLAATMLIGGGLSVLTKLIFNRARPAWPDPISIVAGYSFPSGHAMNSVVFFGCLLVLATPLLGRLGRAALWLLAGTLVLVIGLDRLFLGVHYLSDVVAGWALGAAVVLAMLTVAP